MLNPRSHLRVRTLVVDPGEPCGGGFCYHGASCNHTHHINSSNLMYNISDGVVNGSAMRKDKDYGMGRNDSEVCNCPPLLQGPHCKTPKCKSCICYATHVVYLCIICTCMYVGT